MELTRRQALTIGGVGAGVNSRIRCPQMRSVCNLEIEIVIEIEIEP